MRQPAAAWLFRRSAGRLRGVGAELPTRSQVKSCMAHDVFISHSSKDKPVADAVVAALEAAGISCWVAPRDIGPGMDWGEAIVRGIAGCKVMVLVYSGHCNSSQQVKREVERAVARNKALVPLRIEDVPPSLSLEYFISTPHWLDALTQPMTEHLVRLVEAVRPLLALANRTAAPAGRPSMTRGAAAGPASARTASAAAVASAPPRAAAALLPGARPASRPQAQTVRAPVARRCRELSRSCS